MRLRGLRSHARSEARREIQRLRPEAQGPLELLPVRLPPGVGVVGGHPQAVATHQTAPKLFRHLFATNLQDANVDPLIRSELMGHSTGASSMSGNGLGMTANYTHTRLDTKRKQLEAALVLRPILELSRQWLERMARQTETAQVSEVVL